MEQSASGRSSRTTRRIGYVLAIAVNIVLLVVANNVVEWGWFSWITEDLNGVLPIINVSLVASIVANAAYLAFDPPWLKGVAELGLQIISLIVTIRLLRVFPFDFSTDGWETLTRGLLIAVIVAIGLALIVQVVRLARMAVALDDPERRPAS